jgi:hypothetical protein
VTCALVALLCMSMTVTSRSQAAVGPFEPNDTVLNAAGPLAIHQTYTATLETSSDKDYFFFYVTGVRSSQVTLALTNLGGGTDTSGINAAILDSTGTALDPFAYAVGNGGVASTSKTLNPEKYLLEVDSLEGSADGLKYSLATSGSTGAFGPYAEISGRCERATATFKASRTSLRTAQTKLLRALARLRRARLGTPGAIRSARAAYLRAKERVGTRRKRLKTAAKSRDPWCSIAP